MAVVTKLKELAQVTLPARQLPAQPPASIVNPTVAAAATAADMTIESLIRELEKAQRSAL